MSAPELSIVVTTRDPLRLRWLQNALDAQTLDRLLWEVIFAEDIAGWRLAQAASVVFVHDQARPPEDWLANVRDAVRRHPEAVIHGTVQGDPEDRAMRHAPFWRIDEGPGTVVYPRALLERIGGFPNDAPFDPLGSEQYTDEQVVVYQAVEDCGLTGWLQRAGRLRDVSLLVRRNPEFRNRLHGKVFYRRSHAVLPLALAALALQKRYPPLILLVVPWAVMREPRHHGIRGRIRHMLELPGWAAIDAAELAALTAGSVRHRSLVL